MIIAEVLERAKEAASQFLVFAERHSFHEEQTKLGCDDVCENLILLELSLDSGPRLWNPLEEALEGARSAL